MLKNRREDEIARQAKFYREVYEVFDRVKLRPVMTGGTLLGSVRDGDFIAWDWDGEFTIRRKDIFPGKIEKALDLLKHYNLRKVQLKPERMYIEIVERGWWIEIRAYYREGEYYVWDYGQQRIQLEYLDDISEIELRGKMYNCPRDSEGFLEFTYGKNWAIPIRERNCRKYLTKKRWDKGEL